MARFRTKSSSSTRGSGSFAFLSGFKQFPWRPARGDRQCVKDADGNAVRGAHVWASWQVQWIEQSGRLVATNLQKTVETDTGPDGSYMMCGFTKGAQITAKVGRAGQNTLEEKLVLPASMVLEHDFKLASQ